MEKEQARGEQTCFCHCTQHKEPDPHQMNPSIFNEQSGADELQFQVRHPSVPQCQLAPGAAPGAFSELWCCREALQDPPGI